jgi:hypothetical protein
MADFRIQKNINAATKECSEVINTLYEQKRPFSKNAMIVELMKKFCITERAAKGIVALTITGKFEENGDTLTPKEEPQ